MPVQAEIFRDATTSTGLDFHHFNGMSGELYFAEMMGGGAALFDYDSDGDLDLYLVQGAMLGQKPLEKAITDGPPQLPLHDRLYRNDLEIHADGSRSLRFVDVTAESGLDARGYGMGVASGDFDNDGHPDLYVTHFGSNQLWRNRGPGPDGRITFEDVTQRAAADDNRWSVASVAADLDRDGWLDLYVGNYVDFSLVDHKFCPAKTGGRDYCSPQAYNSVTDRLLRNRGSSSLAFQDVSTSSGLGRLAHPSLGAVSGDFDGNGWIDLYLANDGAPNQLWLNQGDGTFVDDALLAGCAVNAEGQREASMGVAAGDLDGDGHEDLFMTHLHEETNTLYLNRGKAIFRDATRPSGLGTPSFQSTGFGAGLLDVDNDGQLDVLVVNGSVTLSDHATFAARRGAEAQPRALDLDEPNQLFRNRGEGRFKDITAEAGNALARSDTSRGAAFGDLDNDGDTDVVIANNHGPAQVLENVVGQDSVWLGLRLVLAAAPRDALGARAELLDHAGKTLAVRRARTDGSYASSNDPRLLFGLDDSKETSYRVRVTWPDGTAEVFPNVPAKRYTTLHQGTALRQDTALRQGTAPGQESDD